MAASTLLRKVSVLAAKIEPTIGTAISLSGANGVTNVYNLDIKPLIEMKQRQGQGAFGQIAAVQAARMGVFSFDTDLIGGASAPAWMTTFLPACGWVASGLAYSPKTLTPTAAGGVKTLTLGGYRNGVYKQIHGAMGMWSVELIPGSDSLMHFEFTGAWDDPTDAGIITPTFVSTIPPRFASATLTLGSYTPKISYVRINSGNRIYMRPDASQDSGCGYAIVSDRTPTISMDPEADFIAERDTYGLWKAGTTAAFTCTLGSTGNQISFTAPKVQHMQVQEAERDGINIDNVDYQCNKSADTGDDELVITSA